MDVKKDKSKNIYFELIRFCVTGLVAALFDYLTCQLIILAFNSSGSFNEYLITSVSTACGFIIGVIINYLMSTFWVYQNVADKEKTKTPLFIVYFVLLSFGGMVVSILVMMLCNYIIDLSFGLNISDASIIDIFKDYGINFISQGIFWAYLISFGFKTLAGLIFNYFTRKYILYRAPKEKIKNN